jgi:hypothetical protein
MKGKSGVRTFEFQRIDFGNEIPDIIVDKSSDRTCNLHVTIVERARENISTGRTAIWVC